MPISRKQDNQNELDLRCPFSRRAPQRIATKLAFHERPHISPATPSPHHLRTVSTPIADQTCL